MPPELTPKQQWGEHIRTAKSVLVLSHANPDGDAIGSALALRFALEKMGKQVTVAIGGEISPTFSFLPGFEEIKSNLDLHKDLLVILDETQAKIGNVSLKRISETKLVVVITPKEGVLTPANVRLEEGTYDCDLVIVLDSADLGRLGALADEHASLFYDLPVINVDHHPGNSNFGKVNIVDITASSTAEILVSLLETLGKDVPNILDPEIATCLLTGVTTDTGSFQNNNTTPKSLTVAAQLVAAGARQQQIVQELFRTRSLSTLRLWGRALSYIKEDRPLRFAWSALSKADFVASQASAEQSKGLIDELLKTAEGMDFVLLLSERDGNLHGSFRSTVPSTDVSKLAALFGGGGHAQAAAFTMEDTSLAKSEQEVISRVRKSVQGVSDAPEAIFEQPKQSPTTQPTQAPAEQQSLAVPAQTTEQAPVQAPVQAQAPRPTAVFRLPSAVQAPQPPRQPVPPVEPLRLPENGEHLED